MNYEQKYNEALERAEAIYTGKYKPEIAVFAKKSLETIFPELEAYEDERRRKAIHIYLDWLDGRKDCAPRGEYSIRDMIAWLDKQGKKLRGKSILEVAKEEKIEDGNKVEPKFHEGDWIISNNKKSTYQVIEVKRGIYVIRDNVDNHEYHIGIEECEKSGRLWTIKDARCGDVLAAHECYVMFREIDGLNIRCYCTYHYMNNPSFHVDTLHNKDAFHPATKEQRDLLFQKIKEYGYEWDDEKKELKKTETKGGGNESK